MGGSKNGSRARLGNACPLHAAYASAGGSFVSPLVVVSSLVGPDEFVEFDGTVSLPSGAVVSPPDVSLRGVDESGGGPPGFVEFALVLELPGVVSESSVEFDDPEESVSSLGLESSPQLDADASNTVPNASQDICFMLTSDDGPTATRSNL